MVTPKTRKSNHCAMPYRPLIRVPIVPPTTTATTPMRKAQRMTSTKVKRASELSFGIKVRFAATSLIVPTPRVHGRIPHPRARHDRACPGHPRDPCPPQRVGARAKPGHDDKNAVECDCVDCRNRSTGLGPDLLRVRTDLEGLGVAAGELVDGGLELRAFAMLVAADRAADAVELDGQHGVAQRLAADIGDALRIGLGDLLDRLEGELGAVVGVGVI